jgi:hypothetical protein
MQDLYAPQAQIERSTAHATGSLSVQHTTLADHHGKLSSARTKRVGIPRRRGMNDRPCGRRVSV